MMDITNIEEIRTTVAELNILSSYLKQILKNCFDDCRKVDDQLQNINYYLKTKETKFSPEWANNTYQKKILLSQRDEHYTKLMVLREFSLDIDKKLESASFELNHAEVREEALLLNLQTKDGVIVKTREEVLEEIRLQEIKRFERNKRERERRAAKILAMKAKK